MILIDLPLWILILIVLGLILILLVLIKTKKDANKTIFSLNHEIELLKDEIRKTDQTRHELHKLNQKSSDEIQLLEIKNKKLKASLNKIKNFCENIPNYQNKDFLINRFSQDISHFIELYQQLEIEKIKLDAGQIMAKHFPPQTEKPEVLFEIPSGFYISSQPLLFERLINLLSFLLTEINRSENILYVNAKSYSSKHLFYFQFDKKLKEKEIIIDIFKNYKSAETDPIPSFYWHYINRLAEKLDAEVWLKTDKYRGPMIALSLKMFKSE